MNIAIISNQNSYACREYLSLMKAKCIKIDVITISEFPEVSIIEEERCNGLWRPVKENELKESFQFYHFQSLNSIELVQFLNEKKYDIGIQGGTGILKKAIIDCFRIGVLNFHPGDLPNYRGCSAPEWQLIEGNPVVCTCHLIDEGIDSGEILEKKVLSLDMENYHSFRASIYPQIAIFVVEIIESLMYNKNENIFFEKQNHRHAKYRKYIGAENIEYIKKKVFNQNVA